MKREFVSPPISVLGQVSVRSKNRNVLAPCRLGFRVPAAVVDHQAPIAGNLRTGETLYRRAFAGRKER